MGQGQLAHAPDVMLMPSPLWRELTYKAKKRSSLPLPLEQHADTRLQRVQQHHVVFVPRCFVRYVGLLGLS